MGGQIGNVNALKDGRSKDPAKYMRDYRKERMGRIANRPVGRPRKIVEKGDIFEVAARLEKALRRLYGEVTKPQNHWFAGEEVIEAHDALKAYQDYWEKD